MFHVPNLHYKFKMLPIATFIIQLLWLMLYISKIMFGDLFYADKHLHG